MRILCTNDDGYLSPGIRALADVARELGEVHVVAPDREQSGSSNAVTLHRPLRMKKLDDGTAIVDGTPADCVILALSELARAKTPPDLCLSGINHGPNLGEDVLYSGTVAAAMEATLAGIPSVAFSLVGPRGADPAEWRPVVSSLLRQILARPMPPGELLSVNLPPVPPALVTGVRATTLGNRRYTGDITRAPDPSGREYHWIGGGGIEWNGRAEADYRAIRDGCVSVTPLHTDLTAHHRAAELRQWGLRI